MALIPYPKPWEKPEQPATSEAPSKPRGRPFQKGQSGNPKGRPGGALGRKTILRQELEKDGSELAELVKAKAREGDTTAMSLWIARLEPPLRPTALRVQFELDTSLPIADQAKQVVQAMARGELDPDTARQVMDMLSAYVGLKDVETFLAELKRLRESKSRIPGGILES